MDHFWIILGPFSTILLTVLSTVCRWPCGLVHHFLEAKLLERVNLHFWIIYNTHGWFNILLCTCTMSHLCLEVAFLDHFRAHESVDHFFFGTYIFGSHFFHTNWLIISFLGLSETKMIQKWKFQKRNDPPICGKKVIQKCKFQKRNDTNWWIISFLELAFLDHIFSTEIGGSLWCFVLSSC